MANAQSEKLPMMIEGLRGEGLLTTSELGLTREIAQGQTLAFRGRQKDHEVVWYWTTADTHPDSDALYITDGRGTKTLRFVGTIESDGRNQRFESNFPVAGANIEQAESIEMPHYPGTIDIVILGNGRVFLPADREKDYPKLIKSMGY